MKNSIFREFIFNTGWKKETHLELFGRQFKITVKVQAYFEEDGITPQQEEAYVIYTKEEANKRTTIERLLLEYDANASLRFVPSTLVFERNGQYVLLCDDNLEPDDGVAVCLEPIEQVISQDEYL